MNRMPDPLPAFGPMTDEQVDAVLDGEQTFNCWCPDCDQLRLHVVHRYTLECEECGEPHEASPEQREEILRQDLQMVNRVALQLRANVRNFKDAQP